MWFEFAGSVSRGPTDEDEDTCPFNAHLGGFRNNTFRANAVMGMRIYPVSNCIIFHLFLVKLNIL